MIRCALPTETEKLAREKGEAMVVIIHSCAGIDSPRVRVGRLWSPMVEESVANEGNGIVLP